jgi:dolichyl-phosphate beta-glucosyltransferase
MNENIFLTIIVPSYNEEKAIRATLAEIAGYLKEKALTYEVLVVDDGSGDRTSQEASSAAYLFDNFRLMKNPGNMGKGYSVKAAMLSAKGEYALFMDADNSTSIYEIDKFLPYMKTGYDAAIASRRLKESLVDQPQPFLRANMGRFYIFLSKVILGLTPSDFNCGFKLFKMSSMRRIFELQIMNDWSFDVEILFLITKYGLKMAEVPVRWVHKPGSKVRPVKDAVKSFFSILKIKSNDLKGLYKG